MTALQMLSLWGGLAVVCLAGIVFGLVALLRTGKHANVEAGHGKPEHSPSAPGA